ncbi:MAG: hypothetical protein GDA49_02750 [Rhodospirillales bacterium]|nr:hypothetical protein [Rhodospirillales bacterium]
MKALCRTLSRDAREYLTIGAVGRAREQPEALDGICRLGCTEYSDLKTAISECEAGS